MKQPVRIHLPLYHLIRNTRTSLKIKIKLEINDLISRGNHRAGTHPPHMQLRGKIQYAQKQEVKAQQSSDAISN